MRQMKKDFKIPASLRKAIMKIKKAGFKAYVVGGAPRDMLLGRKRTDFDIATNAKPNHIADIFKKSYPTGIKHGTLTVVQNGASYEVTTFRVDGPYLDARRPQKVIFIDDLKTDLSRRDFTINALAYDIESKEIIDHFKGVQDLKKRTIRTVGKPFDRFSEDALRVIRAARFSAVLNFKIAPVTIKAIPKVKQKVKKLSGERIRDELLKMMKAQSPSKGLQVMLKTGLLSILMPELEKAYKFQQGGLHQYDLLTHSFKAVDEAPAGKPLLRIAALFHDIGKVKTRKRDSDGYHFYGHETVGNEIAKKIMKRLKFSNRQIDYVTRLIGNHMFNYNAQWSDGAIRRLLKRVEPENIEDLLSLRVADAKACGEGRKPSKEFFELKRRINKVRKEDMALKIADLKVSGRDVMDILKIGPGKKVGEILDELLNLVLEDNKKNTRQNLIRIIKDIGKI